MSELVSSAQLAEMALPILPKSKQGIEHVAKRDGWPFEYIKGQGRGGRLKKFVLSGLPEEIQAAVRERQAEQLLAQSQPAVLPSVAKAKRPVAVRRMEQLGLPIDDYAMGLNDKQRDCAHARMALAAEVLRLHEVTGFGITDAVQFVVRQVESGQLSESLAYLVPVANARANNQRGISVRTLKGWVAAYRAATSPNERLAALAPRPTKKETPVVQIAWLADFMAHHCRPSAPKLAHSYQEFAKGWLATQPAYELPSLDTVRRVWKRLPQIMQQRGRMTGAAYKSLLPYIRRDWQALRPNDVWIGDGHSFKAKVQHPIHGQPFKPEVTVIIDGCTRMVVGFSLSLAESCVAVADALRIGIKHNGVPLMYYSDNGGGQTGKTIDHEITGLTARLGIHHETGLPGNPQGRGIIERWWQDNLIRLAAQYETFTGSSMDRSTQNLLYRKMDSAFNAWRQGKELTPEQQRYKAKLPSWQQFMADVMQCIADYNNRPHSELPKNADGVHYTPLQYRDLRMQQENLAPTCWPKRSWTCCLGRRKCARRHAGRLSCLAMCIFRPNWPSCTAKTCGWPTTTTMPSGCMCTRWTAALCAKPRWTATNARPCRLRCATSWRKNVPKAESNARKTPSGWRKKKPARPSSNSPTSDYWLAMGTTSPCRRENLRFLCLKATATNGSGSKRSKTGSLRQQAT